MSRMKSWPASRKMASATGIILSLWPTWPAPGAILRHKSSRPPDWTSCPLGSSLVLAWGGAWIERGEIRATLAYPPGAGGVGPCVLFGLLPKAKPAIPAKIGSPASGEITFTYSRTPMTNVTNNER